MGFFLEGVWHDDTIRTDAGGAFQRPPTRFRNHVTPDGSAGPTGEAGFAAAAGRYHLYVSRACPWAHRTLIFRALKGLTESIGISVVHPHMAANRWTFDPASGVVPDPFSGARYLYQVYLRAKSDYSGRVTVPVLWDSRRATIVSNESSDIVRMLNSAFDGVGAKAGDYAPEECLAEIDAINARVYETVNNGVYKAGFATEQRVYEREVTMLFEALAELESRLSGQRYLLGERVTESDWRLFTTLVRFDAVYHGHFKCNLRRLVDYPNLWGYARELYQWPGVADTVNLQHVRQHYYRSHPTINPNGIVPLGPIVDWHEPHRRGR